MHMLRVDELEQRVSRYGIDGLVCVMGDFNIHIAERPSTIIRCHDTDEFEKSGPALDTSPILLERISVDTAGMDDPTQPGRSGIEFVERMDHANMVILNGLIDVGDGMYAESTREHTSIIDYFIVNHLYHHRMDSVRVNGEISSHSLSDHQLITTAIHYEVTRHAIGRDNQHSQGPEGVDNVSHLISSMRYCIKSNGDYEEYEKQCTTILSTLLDQWKDEMTCEDPIEIEQIWYDFKEGVRQAAINSIGMKQTGSGQKGITLPDIMKKDKQLRQWKREKRSIWGQLSGLEAKDTDELSSQIIRLRKRDEWLNRRMMKRRRMLIQKHEHSEIEMVEQLQPTQMREHWQWLKKIGGLHPTRHQQSIPVRVSDSDGTIHTSVEKCKQIWASTWAKLAEHHSNDPRFDRHFHDRVEQEVQTTPPSSSLTDSAASLNDSISLDEVTKSVMRLKNHKSPGCDGIVSEVLKYGGDSMMKCLHFICQIMFDKGDVPMDWLRGVVVPIHKDGDPSNPLNYRPITLLSIVGKVYTGILYNRLMHWSEVNNIMVPEQGGFRLGRGCPEQIYTLTELIKLRKLRKQYTYTCFIDIKKAYDTVWHDGMKIKLKRYGIHGRMYDAICSLYSSCESTIRLGSTIGYTDFFDIDTGVRQGCILSPWLYSLFINDLAIELKQANCGAWIDEMGVHQLTTLLYADDIVLLTNTLDEMKRLLDIVDRYSYKWRFEVNHLKCGLLRFNPSGSTQPDTQLHIGSKVIPWVQSYKYLGIELHNNSPFIQFKERMSVTARRVCHSVAAMGMYSGKLPVNISSRVYEAMVRPLLEYGSEVWSTDPWKEAEAIQHYMAKLILQCPSRSSHIGCQGELGWMSMEGRWQMRRLNLWGKIVLSSPDLPMHRVYDASNEWYAKNDVSVEIIPAVDAEDGWQVYRSPNISTRLTSWSAQIKSDLHTLGLSQYWMNPNLLRTMSDDTEGSDNNGHSHEDDLPSSSLHPRPFGLNPASTPSKENVRVLNKWCRHVKRMVQVREQHYWWRGVQQQSILSTYRSLKQANRLQLSSYLTIPTYGFNDMRRSGRKFLTQLRLGTHELTIHTGRYQRIPVEERICPLCADEVETETHFLLTCPFFDTQRQKLITDINDIIQHQSTSTSTAVTSTSTLTSTSDSTSDTHPSILPSPHPSDMYRSLSELEQVRLMMCSDMSTVIRSQSTPIRHQLISRIMIELNQWRQMRKTFLQQLEQNAS